MVTFAFRLFAYFYARAGGARRQHSAHKISAIKAHFFHSQLCPIDGTTGRFYFLTPQKYCFFLIPANILALFFLFYFFFLFCRDFRDAHLHRSRKSIIFAGRKKEGVRELPIGNKKSPQPETFLKLPNQDSNPDRQNQNL